MAKESKESPMKLAEILSDLVSLRVCDPTAAIALVSVRPNQPVSTSANSTEKSDRGDGEGQEADADLKRAKDLVELHYAVKEAHKRGELGRGLMEARRAVEAAVWGE
ncbi:hypothetical protein K458DRAFT_390554 [Lentithecium fluviatile CBS 122367]|uniref:Uncharacterized protein n=1 Tax=Lentithecium fluviatile CBS 122367 TaxID=1168545 RepID=A0A6G1IWK7_9PLEO|nr:hypothetical protein K458DRAFT_390554 [Lentithecium fluviatile CBS 122367]